jgi:hypothetical protein
MCKNRIFIISCLGWSMPVRANPWPLKLFNMARKSIRTLEKVQILALKMTIFQKCDPRADLGWPWLVYALCKSIFFRKFDRVIKNIPISALVKYFYLNLVLDSNFLLTIPGFNNTLLPGYCPQIGTNFKRQ